MTTLLGEIVKYDRIFLFQIECVESTWIMDISNRIINDGLKHLYLCEQIAVFISDQIKSRISSF